MFNLALAVLAAAAVVLLNHLYYLSLRDASFVNGWMLLALMVFLALFNARKKLPMLPLLNASTWLQVHVYVGLLAAVLFLLHTRLRLPGGAVELLLWCTVVGLLASGFVGLFLSRYIPPRLRAHGELVLFERIPAYRAQLATEAETLVVESVRETASSALAELYAERLAAYFARPGNLLAHLIESGGPIHRLRREMRAHERYLDARGREALKQLEELVLAKENLDYQHALQLVLKGWLFVHVPLTFAMAVLALTHVTLVYAFVIPAQ